MDFPGMYMAEIVDNADPDGASSGRAKVRVFPMMTGLEVSVLPWALPAFGLFEGGSADVGAFTVPAQGSKVWVFFAGGDVRSPVYFASAPGKSDGPAGATPNKKIWKSRSGHTITIDDTPGNEKIKIEGSGDIEIIGASKVTLDPKCEVATASTPLGKCVTTKTLPNCLFSGAPIPGTDNLKAG